MARIRYWLIAILFGVGLCSRPVLANEIGDQLKAYNLLGAWSINCDDDPEKIKDSRRVIYWISFFGTPGKTVILNAPDVTAPLKCGVGMQGNYCSPDPNAYKASMNEYKILSIKKAEDDKIEIVEQLTSGSFPADVDKFFRQPITEIIQIGDSKIRVDKANSLQDRAVGPTTGRATQWNFRCSK